MIDSHCHLTHERFASDLDEIVAKAKQAGLEACVTIGTGTRDAEAAAELADRHAGFVACTVGIDPFTAHALRDDFAGELQRLTTLAASGRFVAIGEIGLDYHYDLGAKRDQQQQLSEQLSVADRLALPVVIHVREAHDDMAHMLATFPRVHGVIHSFTGTPRDAERYLDLGWHLAFNGIVTFSNAEPLRRAAAIVPDDRLLVETDSPYLAPMPLRGKRCEPALLTHTLARLAEVRQTSPTSLSQVTAASARRLFRLGFGIAGERGP